MISHIIRPLLHRFGETKQSRQNFTYNYPSRASTIWLAYLCCIYDIFVGENSPARITPHVTSAILALPANKTNFTHMHVRGLFGADHVCIQPRIGVELVGSLLINCLSGNGYRKIGWGYFVSALTALSFAT